MPRKKRSASKGSMVTTQAKPAPISLRPQYAAPEGLTDDMLLAALSKMSIEDESPQYNALLALAVARGLKKPKRNKARMSKKRRKAKKVSRGIADAERIEARTLKMASTKAKKERAKTAY